MKTARTGRLDAAGRLIACEKGYPHEHRTVWYEWTSDQLDGEMKRTFHGWIARVPVALFVLIGCSRCTSLTVADTNWPPVLKGSSNGTVTITSDRFLKIPAAVATAASQAGAAPFTVAKIPPTIDLAFHGSLPNRATNGTGWSAWGDIAVASDGRVYCGIGDHGKDALGQSQAFLYQWNPAPKVLTQIVDVNAIVPRRHGEPTWSKMHARIDEGADGKIYFTGTLNDGNRAPQPAYKWSPDIPGGQLYQYDPQTSQAVVFANLPAARVTATSRLDRERNIWWCNLEGGTNFLWALDLGTRQELYQAPAGSMGFNRDFALARDGSIFFNGAPGLWKCDAKTKQTSPTRSRFPGDEKFGMRASTQETKAGWIYGVTMRPGRLFRYSPQRDQLELLGADFLAGDYTTVCVLAPDERFLYYLPGSHGSALKIGTPVVQYNLATGQRKVLAFLRETLETEYDYVPAGTYGVKLSADGSTLYVNLNGHAADPIRPKEMRAIGFGLTAFAAIHIPAAER